MNKEVIINIIIPNNDLRRTPPILTCPDSKSNLGKKLNIKRLNSGSDIIKHNTKTNIGYLIFFIILSLIEEPLRFIPIWLSNPEFNSFC